VFSFSADDKMRQHLVTKYAKLNLGAGRPGNARHRRITATTGEDIMTDRSCLTNRSNRAPKRMPQACRAALCGLTLMALIAVAAPTSAQLNKTLHSDGWILAAAHAPGLEGAIWRTDLWVRFEGGSGAVTLTFCETGEDNTGAEEFVYESVPKVIYIEDVVDHFLNIGGGSWVGAIHYETNGNAQVYARVYSISADGSRSFGQLIEGIPTADMSMSYADPGYPNTGEDQWMFAAKHTSDGRFRVNVGIVNPTGVEGNFHYQIFDETNNNPPNNISYTETIPPYSMLQLSDPFAQVNGGDWSSYSIRLEAATAGTGLFGYASVVDNATNDAFFVRGVKLFEVTD